MDVTYLQRQRIEEPRDVRSWLTLRLTLETMLLADRNVREADWLHGELWCLHGW